MKIILSPNSGFCFGVKRAVDKVYKAIDTRDDIYTLGPIIHNPQVVGDLADKGVNILKNIDDIEDGTVVIRSHGIGHTEYENLKFKNLDLIDATCPYVKRIHKIVQKHWNMGYDIIVIGEADHPEVMGINGWCNNESHVIYSANDIENLPNIDRACVVAQTTILQSKWDDLVAKLHTNIKDLKVFNTRCNATHIRQEAAKQLAAKVDIMIVIGGKNSSNTHKLYQLCKERCENTFAIESAKDINKNMLDAGEIVGVTAGASTPIWLIEEVVETMESINREKNSRDVKRGMDENLRQEHEGEVVENEMAETEKARAENTVVEQVEAEEVETEETIEQVEAGEVETEEIVEQVETGEAETEEDIEQVEAGEEETEEDIEQVEAEEETKTDVPEMSMDDFEDTFITLNTGQIVTGTVLSVSSEEIIVNIGYKSDGIITKDDLSLADGQEPTDLVEVGEEIKAIVIRLDDGEGNVRLSQRQLKERESWEALEAGYEAKTEFRGQCLEAVKGGVIAKVKDLKAFVPASHISTRYIENLETVVGQDMRLRIIEIDRRKNRLVASQKDILEEERKVKEEALWNTIEDGQRIKGVVKNIVSFGAFVDIGGVDGLVHISDLAWTHVEKPEDVLSVGDEIEVIVLSADRERERISLGYKQILPHPWDNVEQKYIAESIISGVVSRITDFGAFIELEPGVDGLVHISQISTEHVEKVEDYLSPGERVDVKVLNVDSENRRISLSIKDAIIDTKPKKEKTKPKTQEEKIEESLPEDDDMMVSMRDFFPKQFDED